MKMKSDSLFVGDLEDNKMNQLVHNPCTPDTNPELELTLSLGRNNIVRESLPNLSFNSLNATDFEVTPSLVENSNGREVMKPKEDQFPCMFCEKKFSNKQALGGHQKAHRHERFLLKRKKLEDDMIASGLSAQVTPYQAIPDQFPFHVSPIYQGAWKHPLAQMSSIPSHHFGLGYDNGGLHRRSLSGTQFGMASNSLGESSGSPMLNNTNLGLGFELGQVSSFSTKAINRAATTRTDPWSTNGNYSCWN